MQYCEYEGVDLPKKNEWRLRDLKIVCENGVHFT
jgi:hypothetical protein